MTRSTGKNAYTTVEDALATESLYIVLGIPIKVYDNFWAAVAVGKALYGATWVQHVFDRDSLARYIEKGDVNVPPQSNPGEKRTCSVLYR